MRILIIILSFLFALQASARVLINEVMQSNIDLLIVEKDYPDSWMELYNDASTEQSLDGWRVGISRDFDNAYILSNYTIAGQGYFVVYCDKNGEGAHTDFRIDSGKSELYLFRPEGDIADSISLKKMISPNVSYGRSLENNDNWGYFTTATPGSLNNSPMSELLPPDPTFSQAGGIFSEPFELVIRMPEDYPHRDVSWLAVTLDGANPSTDDIITGSEYRITVDENTVVRAKIITTDALDRIPVTHSYILDHAVDNRPIVSIVTDSLHLYSEETGIFFGAPDDKNANFQQTWRRPVNIEMFVDGNNSFNQLCEIKIMGSETRTYPQKSINVYANKRFGTKRFDMEGVWTYKPDIHQVKSFSLRNSGQDFYNAHMRDALMQRLIGTNIEGMDWLDSRAAVVYINGVYKGIYDIRERSNEDFIEANYNELDDFDMIENGYEVSNGSIDLWRETMDKVNDATATYEEISTIIDINNLVSYFLPNMVGDNIDYMHNNNIMWTTGAGGEYPKWRWVLKDMDFAAFSFSKYTRNPYQWILTQQERYTEEQRYRTLIFKRMLEWEESRQLIIERVSTALGDFLNSAVIAKMVDDFANEIEDEYLRHCAVYFDDAQRQYDVWKNEIAYINDWFSHRPDYLYDFTSEFFGLGRPVALEIAPDEKVAPLIFNDCTLKKEAFVGKYFENRMIQLATPDNAEMRWSVTVQQGEKSDCQIFDCTTLNYVIPANADKVTINYLADISAIDIIETDCAIPSDLAVNVLNIMGQQIASGILKKDVNHILSKGFYILIANGYDPEVVCIRK